MSHADQALREWLRAKAREMDAPKLETREDVRDLVEACAYEHWHRMLFARFLAENGLLVHPDYGVPLTLAECAELAAAEGEPDGWMVAARYAARMLPGIFRANDPLLSVPFAPNDRERLEALLVALPPAVFTSDDGLGWVYQFWQAKRKGEINASGAKIDNGLIAPVTQLFSEPYMVSFLLDNTLGAWWAARHPESDLNDTFTSLRRAEDSTPICGGFPKWPDTAAQITVMDPCTGSGHFLHRAFHILCQMREREEGLSPADAGDAVLRDNLFGLELEPRCVQIAAFSLALEAWKRGGYRPLPVPHIACSGIAARVTTDWWTRLIPDDGEAELVLRELHNLFHDAGDLGSLIGPRRNEGLSLGTGDAVLARVQPKLEALLERTSLAEDPTTLAFGASAAGAVAAARLLLRRYHLVASNVPFLARGRQSERLRGLIETRYPDAKADLATAMLERCRDFCHADGAYALVTPQNWLFLGSYKKLLKEQTWHAVARLGTGAFLTVTGEVVNVALSVLANARPPEGHLMHGLDAAAPKEPAAKAALLRSAPVQPVAQAAQLRNPDARLAFDEADDTKHLSEFAQSLYGLRTADSNRFIVAFWEVTDVDAKWQRLQSTVTEAMPYGGREHLIFWENGRGALHRLAEDGYASIQGGAAWGKQGVIVGQMRFLPATLYTGEVYDNNTVPIIPKDPAHLPAIWALCSSSEYHTAVRRIDQKMNVMSATLVKVPFDLARWQAVAAEKYPNGLPEPHSDDPTQWLFKGEIATSTDPLQVAVARLLGYRWPDQAPDALDAQTDADGIVCLPPVRGEHPAAERLRALLAAAYGEAWSPATQDGLLAAVGYPGKGLETWLRDGFWSGHCARFGNRPFIWQITDGRKDGFSALVNCHTLDRQKLEKLTYTYLGDWLERQRGAVGVGEPGAEARLAAAQTLQGKLAKIIEGEPPYDLFVRWKPLYDQAIGWAPDLNDGVRFNIRPFVEAGVLRGKFTIGWKKDRGENPPSLQLYKDGPTARLSAIGASPPWVASWRAPTDAPDRKTNERHNDFHFTRAEKQAARDAYAKRATPDDASPATTREAPLPLFSRAAISAGGDGGGVD